MFDLENGPESELMDELGRIGVEEEEDPGAAAASEVDEHEVTPPAEEDPAPDPDADPAPFPAPATNEPSVDDLRAANARLEAQLAFLKQQGTPAPQQPDGEVVNPDDDFWDRLQNDPRTAVRDLVNDVLAPINQERQLETLAKNLDPIAKHFEQMNTEEGVNQFFAKVNELAKEIGNPSLVRNPTPRILRMAAEDLWGRETRDKAYQSGLAKGREEAASARRNKQGAESVVTSKPQQQKSATDEMADLILEAGRAAEWFTI